METITILVIMGILGLGIGIILSLFSHIFAPKKDPMIEQVKKALPGINCGMCVYSNCEEAAKAIVSGEAKFDICKVDRAKGAEKIKNILMLK